MYRKLLYLFSGAAGSIGVGYGIKNKFLNIDQPLNAQEIEKNSVDVEKIGPKFDFRDKEIIPLNRPVVTTPYDGYEAPNPLDGAIVKARDLAYRMKDEVGAPGLVIGVSIDGITVWAEGLGLADVENRVTCHPETVMRIASISKSMTMAVVARLWQEGKLDLDKPVQDYVPSFPKKKFNKEEVKEGNYILISDGMKGISIRSG
ncbi:Serine beta-lactamase-like protein LACTB [Blattella germanica]|nr:Serine beta-lactamase-like protein LACTB [Blattella germanica]